MRQEEVLLAYPKILRQSTISTADICSLRLKWNLDPNMPRSSSIMRAMGTGYHAGLAEFYSQLRQGIPLDDIDWQRVWEMAHDDLAREFGLNVDDGGTITYSEHFDWRFQPQTKRQEEVVYSWDQTLTQMNQAMSHYFDNGNFWPPDRYKVVGVEQPFDLPFLLRPGWKRTGTMDLVLHDTDTGWVHVVDHKLTRKKWYASKATPSNSPQAAFYVAAAQELYGTPSVTFNYDVTNLMPDLGFNRIDAPRTYDHIDATLERAAAVADLIENGGPLQPNVQSFLCSDAYCDYWNLCPYGSRLHT